MKLRIHGNSLRLRLNRSDVKQIQQTGICTESLRFGQGSQLTYSLETSSQLTVVDVEYRDNCIRVLLPISLAQEWAGSDQISLSFNPADDAGPSVLIEKDFQCLHRDQANPENTENAFPNPSAGDQRGARL